MLNSQALTLRRYLLDDNSDYQYLMTKCDGDLERTLEAATTICAMCSAIAMYDTGSNIDINDIPEEDKVLITAIAFQALQYHNPRNSDTTIQTAFDDQCKVYRQLYLNQFDSSINDLLDE